jgi:hypothetical protein
MRGIRLLLATALVATMLIALPGTASAATCATRSQTYEYRVGITQYNFDGMFRSASTATGRFKITARGCWDGSTSWGTSVTWAIVQWPVVTRTGGPSYYTNSSGVTDFWLNATYRINGDNWEWCQINLFPRLKLTKTGGWSTTGTTYTISENKNPFYTSCIYYLKPV